MSAVRPGARSGLEKSVDSKGLWVHRIGAPDLDDFDCFNR